MGKEKATRRSGNYDASWSRLSQGSGKDIIQQFERGSLIASVIMALSFGAATLMWAVVA